MPTGFCMPSDDQWEQTLRGFILQCFVGLCTVDVLDCMWTSQADFEQDEVAWAAARPGVRKRRQDEAEGRPAAM
eukprot:14275079-Alexandrium_andersonii.AAC.1